MISMRLDQKLHYSMIDPSRIACPHCGQPYRLTPEYIAQYAGRYTTCETCAAEFLLPTPPRPPDMSGVCRFRLKHVSATFWVVFQATFGICFFMLIATGLHFALLYAMTSAGPGSGPPKLTIWWHKVVTLAFYFPFAVFTFPALSSPTGLVMLLVVGILDFVFWSALIAFLTASTVAFFNYLIRSPRAETPKPPPLPLPPPPESLPSVPSPEPLPASADAWRKGDLFILRRGACLPCRCAECGAPLPPAQVSVRFTWRPALRLGNLLVRMTETETVNIQYSFCNKHRPRLSKLTAKRWTRDCFILAGFSLLTGIINFRWDYTIRNIAFIIAALCLLASMLIRLLKDRIRLRRVDNDLACFSGFGQGFLATFPDFNQQDESAADALDRMMDSNGEPKSSA